MTPTQLRKCLEALHWSQREFASIIKRNDRLDFPCRIGEFADLLATGAGTPD